MDSQKTGGRPVYRKPKPNFIRRRLNKVDDYLLDHFILKTGLSWAVMLLAVLVSAFSFAYGYRSFIAPTGGLALISGGASGISQIILRIFQLFGYSGSETTIQSLAYLIVNIPLFFIAWRFIGREFTVLTIINVLLTSFFIKFIPESWATIFDINGDYIARALFAGILTGVSSGVAYMVGTSAGGIDIVTFALAERKSTTVGKYSVFINTVIVLAYTVINAVRLGNLSEVTMALYTIIYFFTSSKTLDIINIKNKKTELQINTDNVELAPILLRAFPHGCTVIDAIGGYTGKPRKIIYMVVSANEVKQVVNFARRIDSNCFVNVTNSTQVYGKFYIKPIK